LKWTKAVALIASPKTLPWLSQMGLRICYHELRARHVRKKLAGVRLFAAALVILLRDRSKELECIFIDQEYPG
jgi:hypothetical protein